MYKKRSEFKKIAAIAVGACGIAYGFGGAEVQAAPPEGGNWTLLPAVLMSLMETVWMRTNGQTESGMMSQQISLSGKCICARWKSCTHSEKAGL